MPVVTCPACQRKARVPNAARGKTVKCPGCGTSFAATNGKESGRQPSEPDETGSADSASPADDGRRAEQVGAGLLTLSQTAFAISLALQLLNALLAMTASDPGVRSPTLVTVVQLVSLVAVLAGLAGTLAALVGSIFCIVPTTIFLARAAVTAVLVLTVLAVIRDSGASFRDPNQNRILMLSLAAFEASRQALLAVYARIQARWLGDAATAKMALFVAISYPAVVVGLCMLGILVAIFSSGKPNPRFDQAMKIVDLLAQTVLIAWSAFVLGRVWTGIRLK